MNDPIKINYLKKGEIRTRLISDKESAENAMYTLTRYYIRDVFGPGTNVILREFLDEIIKDQMESFNE